MALFNQFIKLENFIVGDTIDDVKLIGNTEFLNRVILTDGGRLYHTILAKIASALMMNGGLEQLEQMEELTDELRYKKEEIEDLLNNEFRDYSALFKRKINVE